MSYMTLVESQMTDCIKIIFEKERDADGNIYTYARHGESFCAAVAFDRSIQAKTAMAQGVKDVYTAYIPIEVGVGYHDVFMRLCDGVCFRITSNPGDNNPPPMSTLKYCVASCEIYKLEVQLIDG
jgi:hypothetical protein